MQQKININIVVNSITALSNKKLEGSVWLMDNSCYNSTGQGTTKLTTFCMANQEIRWKITPVDLQTPASIKSVHFLGSSAPMESELLFDPITKEVINPDLNLWSGLVPMSMTEGVEYRYRLGIQIGQGKHSLMYIDSPSIKRVGPNFLCN